MNLRNERQPNTACSERWGASRQAFRERLASRKSILHTARQNVHFKIHGEAIMPVHVIKKPIQGLLYYHFQGYCTSAETVQAAQEATQEYPGEQLVTIFDFLEGELDIEQLDVKRIIEMNKQLVERGIITTHAAILTQSRPLEIFVMAVELMSFDLPTKISTFPSLIDGLKWLGLAKHEQELKEILSSLPK